MNQATGDKKSIGNRNGVEERKFIYEKLNIKTKKMSFFLWRQISFCFFFLVLLLLIFIIPSPDFFFYIYFFLILYIYFFTAR